MDRMIYLAMTGAKQIMFAQEVNANNLANVSTAGFRADLAAFESAPVNGVGYPSRVYSQLIQPGINLMPGTMVSTGRDLDVAIQGEGYIAVQADDGQEAYTRAGDLQINANGQLMTGAGHLVMGNGGPIALPPYEKIEIGVDGTLSIKPVGQGPSALAVVDRIKLVNPEPEQLIKGPDGLLRLKNEGKAEEDATVRVSAGSLESSNVNTVDAMVNMITLARQFELHVKMMKAAEENDASSASMMRLG